MGECLALNIFPLQIGDMIKVSGVVVRTLDNKVEVPECNQVRIVRRLEARSTSKKYGYAFRVKSLKT